MSLTPPAGPRVRPQPGWVLLAVAGAFGALQTWAWVHTAAWPLPLLAMAWLAHRVLGCTPGRAAALGWAFGTGWVGAATWWLFISLHRYGQLPAVLSVLAVLALAAALSLYLALAMYWVARARSGRAVADASRFAAAWLAAELARGVWFTGFPWAATGYSQVDGPLALWLPWVGVYAVGAMAAWIAACLGLGWTAPPSDLSGRGPAAPRALRLPMKSPPNVPRPGVLALALLALALPAAWGNWQGPFEFTASAGSLRVALLQTNVAQDEKFAAEHLPAALVWVADALQGAKADLVLAPETAVPLLPDQLDELVPGYWADLQRHFSQPGGPAALVGVPLGSYEQGYTNSVVGLAAPLPADAASSAAGGASAPGAANYRYDKYHLVPFGEFIPNGFRWFTELMNIPLGDFNRGVINPPSFMAHGQRVAPNICYEDLFGEALALRFAVQSQAPTILANVGNIGWFGNTIAVPQHLQISRVRALELQRPMLRATNTGATAVIDHRGVVQAALPPFTRGVLQASVQGRQGLTPFARWAAVAGLWPLWALAGLGLGWPRGRPGRPR